MERLFRELWEAFTIGVLDGRPAPGGNGAYVTLAAFRDYARKAGLSSRPLFGDEETTLAPEGPRFHCHINGMVVDNGDDPFVIVFATVKNIGGAPSKILSIRLRLLYGDATRQLEIVHPRSVRYQEPGTRIKYYHPDALFEKGGKKPITPGDVVRGYVVGKIKKEEAALEGADARVQIIVFDAFEKGTYAEKPLTSFSPGFLPGTSPEVEKITDDESKGSPQEGQT